MDNLISETNTRLQEVVDNLSTIKDEYEKKLEKNTKQIETELNKVNKYKEEFFTSKEKIEKMNSDIEGFEEDYKKLVERFKDDELANILIAANKEISAKIDERKRKIVKDKVAMNELVEKAENVKQKLVKLTAEKKGLETCLVKINDSYEFYTKTLTEIINYSTDHKDYLCAYFNDSKSNIIEEKEIIEDVEDIEIDSNILVNEFDESELDNDTVEIEEEIIIEEDDDEVEDDEEEVSEEIEEDIDESDDEDIIDDDDDEIIEEVMDVQEVNLDELEEDIDEDEVSEDNDETEEEVTEEEPEDEEISDYDNEDVIEGEEHKIVVDTDIDFNINLDDSLQDDDSLYE